MFQYWLHLDCAWRGRRANAAQCRRGCHTAQSVGIGPHEQGREAIDFFTRVKTVYINFT
jgi:hypothetical protein